MKKLIFCLPLLALSLAQASIKETLQKPLITGASVSADHKAVSPGKILSLRYTQAQQITTIAKGGRPGLFTVPLITDQEMKDRTAVIAIDLFFWDSGLPGSGSSLRSLHQFFDIVTKYNLPLVIGDIPEMIAGRQPGRATLNQEIKSSCAAYRNCHVFSLDEWHQQVVRDGYLMIKGQKYTLRELVPDGLHLSPVASEYLADQMESLLL